MSEDTTHDNGQQQWSGGTDGSNWMHRALIASIKYINIRLIYLGMAVLVVPFYLLFSRKGYRAIYRYFRQHHHFGRFKSFAYTYYNHYRFGQVVIDRFAVYAGKKFEFEVEGNDDFLDLYHGDEGFMILSSHVGNYEMVGYAFEVSDKKFNALVYPGEAKAIMENRARLFSGNNISMIAVSNDMSHIIKMSQALANGEILSIFGDRIFGSPRYIECELLGSPVRLPLGPYSLAVQREVPVLTMFAIKQSAKRYKIVAHRLQLPSGYEKAKRLEKAEAIAHEYIRQLESIVKLHPEQWFNYFDFWNDDN